MVRSRPALSTDLAGLYALIALFAFVLVAQGMVRQRKNDDSELQ